MIFFGNSNFKTTLSKSVSDLWIAHQIWKNKIKYFFFWLSVPHGTLGNLRDGKWSENLDGQEVSMWRRRCRMTTSILLKVGKGGGGHSPPPPWTPVSPIPESNYQYPKMILHNRGHVCMMINLTCEHLNLVRLLEDFNDVKCD